MIRLRRTIALAIIDALLVTLALLAALWLRFDGAIPEQYITSSREMALPFAVSYVVSFYFFGLYRRLWQYASTGELLAILQGVTLGTVVNIALAYFFMEGSTFPLPRTVFPLAWMLNILFIGGSRLSWRLLRDYGLNGAAFRGGRPVLIVGAGDAGAAVVRELKNNIEARLVPVGFVDDDPAKQRQQLLGVPVLGTRLDIPRLVDDLAVQDIIIAMPSVPGRMIREIVEVCQGTPARLQIVPGMYELIDGRVNISQIREVKVEDVLGRDPVNVDLEAMAGYLAGRVVLVTGAGGSIGSELCRQISQFAPRRLILLGHGENSIHNIYQELINANPDLELVRSIVDVRDAAAVTEVMRRYQPQVVFHAAAHKHVPLMEVNPGEALKNNALGTWNVAAAAKGHGVEIFILISTDKAVNPTSIMGASKKLAEMVVQYMNWESPTRFAAVRFGNVLGSRGSVVPLFQEQIARGGPVTVTHPEMTRYFMTIPEAVQLIIQAGAMAKGGEIFVLDMGEPVRIEDLARSMIRLSGFDPDEDIEIVYTGVRPGEKLHEELFTEAEKVEATRHRRILVSRMNGVEEDVRAVPELVAAITAPSWAGHDVEEVLGLVRRVFPGFRREERAAGRQVAAAAPNAAEQNLQPVLKGS